VRYLNKQIYKTVHYIFAAYKVNKIHVSAKSLEYISLSIVKVLDL